MVGIYYCVSYKEDTKREMNNGAEKSRIHDDELSLIFPAFSRRFSKQVFVLVHPEIERFSDEHQAN